VSEREGSQRERVLSEREGSQRGLPAPGRCVVMGVLNVTPDSFSDGGRYADLDAAIAHGLALRQQGADLVDVGGESTRPGADRVPAEEEIRRVVPAIRALAADGVPVSVDTTRAAVASSAIEAGARVVNDVSGGLADPGMARVVAGTGVCWVLMHWRGHSRDMQALARYDDVVAEVVGELAQRVDAAVAAGVDPARLAIDPGLGFAKTAEHNWALLARLDALRAVGLPILVGTSRKSFLGRLLAAPDGTPRPVGEREDGTVATTVLAALAGVWGVRVHQVRPNLDAILVVDAYRRAVGSGTSPVGSGTSPVGSGTSPVGTGTSPVGTAGPGGTAGAASGADRIALRGLRAHARHGVFASERRAGQEFVVDAVLELDTGPAAATDALARTVDYGTLAQDLAAVLTGEPVDLLETLADRLVRVCLRSPLVASAEVTVHKPAAPIPLPFDDVAVTVRRSRP
jgi:dihydropteroate synthase